MTGATKPPEDEKVACDICLKEVSISEAKSEEASDYVYHFCGLECYAKWREQSKKDEN